MNHKDFLKLQNTWRDAVSNINTCLPDGITVNVWLCMNLISDGFNQNKSLSTLFDVKTTYITGITTYLQKIGYITAEPGSRDHRESIFTVTSEGRQFLESVNGKIGAALNG